MKKKSNIQQNKQPAPSEEKAPIKDLNMLFKSDFSDDLLESCLNQGKIKASEKPDNPPQILWVDDCVFATFGNFSASTGRAKTKKTFNLSAIVASAMKNGRVLNYTASLPEDKRKIFYFDTEQSRFHCHNVLKRIMKLAGLPDDSDSDLITFVGLREYTPSLRLSLIDYALRTSKGYGLVIIDGLRDLMYDINSAKESTDVMTMLMNWTSKYMLHIHCVLHLNKNDSNTRGHIGTELENKAETVLMISKDKNNSDISSVAPMHMRDKEFTTFAFHIDDNALPVLEEDYHVTVVKTKDLPLTSLPNEVHKMILDELFATETPTSYSSIVDLLCDNYAKHGYKRGINAVKDILKSMNRKHIIEQVNKKYIYHPENLSKEGQV